MSPGSPLQAALVVALGAIPGAWLRYGLLQAGTRTLRSGHWAIWSVNMLACFLMGLLVGGKPGWHRISRESIELVLAVGFLGSLSSYSTLMVDLVTIWRKQGRNQSLQLAVASVVGGLLICRLGVSLGQGKP